MLACELVGWLCLFSLSFSSLSLSTSKSALATSLRFGVRIFLSKKSARDQSQNVYVPNSDGYLYPWMKYGLWLNSKWRLLLWVDVRFYTTRGEQMLLQRQPKQWQIYQHSDMGNNGDDGGVNSDNADNDNTKTDARIKWEIENLIFHINYRYLCCRRSRSRFLDVHAWLSLLSYTLSYNMHAPT